MTPLVAHVRSLWGGWGALSPIPLVAWPVAMIASGMPRWDYFAFAAAVLVLAYGNRWSKRLFLVLYPLALVAILYDGMHFVQNVGVTEERLHICDLRAIDLALLSVNVDGAPTTVHDWLQRHPSPVLDRLFAIPYGTFIFATLLFAIYLYTRDKEALRRFGWTFFFVNFAGFATYHLYPAAPPWYYHAHGCSADLAAKASEGPNLARVDVWLGVPYFHALYGRASDVFGSVPSLHVAYPMMVVLGGWVAYGRVARGLALVFLASMCLAAVYLDHHWIVDVLLGLLFATVGHLAVKAVTIGRARLEVTP